MFGFHDTKSEPNDCGANGGVIPWRPHYALMDAEVKNSPLGISPTAQLITRLHSSQCLYSTSVSLPCANKNEYAISPQVPCIRKRTNVAWICLAYVKVLLVLAALVLLIEALNLLWIGEGFLILPSGRYHQHNSYHHGLHVPELSLTPDAIVIIAMGSNFFSTGQVSYVCLSCCR